MAPAYVSTCGPLRFETTKRLQNQLYENPMSSKNNSQQKTIPLECKGHGSARCARALRVVRVVRAVRTARAVFLCVSAVQEESTFLGLLHLRSSFAQVIKRPRPFSNRFGNGFQLARNTGRH